MATADMEDEIELKVRVKEGCEDLPLPRYMSEQASGMDLCAAVEEPVTLSPDGDRELIPTGIHIALPPGYEGQVRPRSGLALDHGIIVPNSPGTIDSDYRAEVGVILANLGSEPFTVERGMRIAQLVIARVQRARTVQVTSLPSSERHHGGFGSTGV